MFQIKWKKRILFAIIWDFKRWHYSRNPVRKRPLEIIGKGAAEILDMVGTFPATGE